MYKIFDKPTKGSVGNETATAESAFGESHEELCCCIVSDEEIEQRKKYGKRKKGISKVWKYFKKSHDKKLAKCLHCAKEYKTSGNTSNLLDHLKRFHPNLDKDEEESVSNNSGLSSLRSVDSYFKRAIQYDNNSKRKADIDSALVGLVAQDFQPFNIVSNSGFRNLVKVLDPRYVLPSPNHLRDKYFKNHFKDLKERLVNILTNVSYVALTTDGWTLAANEGYITLTCHFIDHNFDLRSAVLSTNKLEDVTNHKAENVANTIKIIMSEWDITNKVNCIVTDNAAVMVKACELLQKKHLPCYAHTINLVIQDSLKNNKDLEIIFKKCKTIVTFFKSSTIAYEKFKLAQNTEKPYSLLQETPTRWNSTFFMVERILSTKDAIAKVLLGTRKAPAPLAADEISVLSEVKSLLEIFHEATKKVSGSKYVTLSLMIPLAYGLSQKLTNRCAKTIISAADSINDSSSSSSLLDFIDTRVTGKVKTSKHFISITYMLFILIRRV